MQVTVPLPGVLAPLPTTTFATQAPPANTPTTPPVDAAPPTTPSTESPVEETQETSDLLPTTSIEDISAIAGMQKHLARKYAGYSYSTSFPSLGKAKINMSIWPEEVRATYEDEKIDPGQMQVLPIWITKIGNGIRSQVANGIRSFAVNADSRFGHLVPQRRVPEVEAMFLSLKGIEDKDYDIYRGTDIVADAQAQIEARREKLDDFHKARMAPVTYWEFIQYCQDNYDVLREQILQEYREMFKGDGHILYSIAQAIPPRSVFFDTSKMRFSWTLKQEIPACLTMGDTSLTMVLGNIRAEKELEDKKSSEESRLLYETNAMIARSTEEWKTNILESAKDIQFGIRKHLGVVLGRLKKKLDQTPMTEEELAEKKAEEGKNVRDPSKVSAASIKKLLAVITESQDDLGEFSKEDGFYKAVEGLKETLGMTNDFEDEDTRTTLSETIEQIVELSLDSDDIDPESGDFFMGIS
jgi:hypothetical protein